MVYTDRQYDAGAMDLLLQRYRISVGIAGEYL